MDSITMSALIATIGAAFFYVGYWVIRRAVAAGIADARSASRTQEESPTRPEVE